MRRTTRNARRWWTAAAILAIAPWAALFAADDGGDLAAEIQERALRACVKVVTPIRAGPGAAGGSGTVLDTQGFLVTNFHVVGRVEMDRSDATSTFDIGDYYNADRRAVVSIATSWAKPPMPTYYAEVLAGDPKHDLAVLKIVAPYAETSQPLPAVLPVTTLSIGDSEKVKPGSRVYVFGYPGVGGDTITYTDGKIAGFVDDDDAPPIDWLKTTAAINGGNSGGTAIDAKGALVGIPTMTRSVGDGGDRMAYLRASAHVVPLLAAARKTWRTRVEEGRGRGDGAAPSGTPTIEPLRFGTGWVNGRGLTGAGSTFAAGTKKVWVDVRFKNFVDGSRWRYAWTRNGSDEVAKDAIWDDGASGSFRLTVWGVEDRPLESGVWVLTISLGETVVRRGTMTILPPPGAKAPPAPEMATLTGTVKDAATNAHVAGAIVIVLHADKRVADWWKDSGYYGPSVLAHATTDVSGRFSMPAAIPRGPKYSVVVIARGYGWITKDGALDSTVPGTLDITATLDKK